MQKKAKYIVLFLCGFLSTLSGTLAQNSLDLNQFIKIMVDQKEVHEMGTFVLGIFNRSHSDSELNEPMTEMAKISDVCRSSTDDLMYFTVSLKKENVFIYPKEQDIYCAELDLEETFVVQFKSEFAADERTRLNGFNNVEVESFKPVAADDDTKAFVEEVFTAVLNTQHLQNFEIFQAEIGTVAELIHAYNEVVYVSLFYDMEYFSSLPESARTFVILHEIGHLDIGKYHPDSKKVQELKADEFAGEEFRRLNPNMSWEEFQGQIIDALFSDFVQSPLYPQLNERLKSIKDGWFKGTEVLNSQNEADLKRFASRFNTLEKQARTLPDKLNDFQSLINERSSVTFEQKSTFIRRLGIMCYEKKIWERAEQYLDEYLNAVPGDIDAKLIKIEADYKSHGNNLDPNTASNLVEIIESDDYSKGVRSQAAFVYSKMLQENNELVEASKYLKRTILYDPTYTGAYLRRARLLKELYTVNVDSLIESVKMLKRAIEMEPAFGIKHDHKLVEIEAQKGNSNIQLYRMLQALGESRHFREFLRTEPNYCNSQRDFNHYWTRSAYLSKEYPDAAEKGAEVLKDTINNRCTEISIDDIALMTNTSRFMLQSVHGGSLSSYRELNEVLSTYFRILSSGKDPKLPAELETILQDPNSLFKNSLYLTSSSQVSGPNTRARERRQSRLDITYEDLLIAQHYVAAITYLKNPVNCDLIELMDMVEGNYPLTSEIENPGFDRVVEEKYLALKSRRKEFMEIKRLNANKKERTFCNSE